MQFVKCITFLTLLKVVHPHIEGFGRSKIIKNPDGTIKKIIYSSIEEYFAMAIFEQIKDSPKVSDEKKCYLMGRCPRWEAFKVNPDQKCSPVCFNTEKERTNAYKIAYRECSPKWRTMSCEDRNGGYNYTLVPCPIDDIPPCPKFDFTLKVTPWFATLKLNGVVKQLKYTDGQYQYSEKVAQRIKMEVEVYHPDYKTQAFTIQMGEKPFVENINLEKFPWDKLKTIEVKNSDDSYSSNDLVYARVSNPVSSCITYLSTWSNDFQSGNLDTFTNLDNTYDGTYPGDCQDFNITELSSFEIQRWPFGNVVLFSDVGENWLSDYIRLNSDNQRVSYKCTYNDWIPANQEWYKFDCTLY